MRSDDTLFFTRRVGLGLRPGETVEGSLRDWAVAQISEVQPLDFFGPNGVNLLGGLAPDAKPHADFDEACRDFEVYRAAQEHLEKVGNTLSEREYDALGESTVWTPYVHVPRWRDSLAKTLTAVNGNSPVFERFWWFWCNHFTVSTNEAEIKIFYGPHTRNIRRNMTGRFADLLHDAILNPAMLVYLDNWLSTGPNSTDGKRNDGNLNENLARELLELHTMSPEGGYSQGDVVEAALALTGWQFYAGVATHGERLKEGKYGTWFQRQRHEPGKRKVLGKTYGTSEKGRNQAIELIADLAVHPATSLNLSRKLATHFVADDPPQEAIQLINEAWVASDGDLVAIHTAVIDAVLQFGRSYSKFSTPERWLTEAYRTTGVFVPLTRPYPGTGEYWIDALFKELGQAHDQSPQPNGYSDSMKDWLSKESLDRRLRLSYFFGLKIQGSTAESLKDYAVRLAGEGSDLAVAIRRSPSKMEATAMLLSSPDFLKY